MSLFLCLRATIGDVFVAHAGYNGVAEVNNLIVLYPQVVNTTLNPAGCWDWYVYGDVTICVSDSIFPLQVGIYRSFLWYVPLHVVLCE